MSQTQTSTQIGSIGWVERSGAVLARREQSALNPALLRAHRDIRFEPAPSERMPMKAIAQDTYGKADVFELREFDKPVQDTYGSADVQTATGGTR